MIYLPSLYFLFYVISQYVLKFNYEDLSFVIFTLINLRPRPIILRGIMLHGRRTLTFNILCCLVLNS
jgi:hypothetical protein